MQEHTIRIESAVTSSSENIVLSVDGLKLRLSLAVSVRRQVLLAGGSAWLGIAAVPSSPSLAPLLLSWEFAGASLRHGLFV